MSSDPLPFGQDNSLPCNEGDDGCAERFRVPSPFTKLPFLRLRGGLRSSPLRLLSLGVKTHLGFSSRCLYL